MSYQLYRNTTLGNCLQESLDELIQTHQITPSLALQVLLEFDKAISRALSNNVRHKMTFKGSLNTYRFCDNVWTFVLSNVDFKEPGHQPEIHVDKMKIVACDAKDELVDTEKHGEDHNKWKRNEKKEKEGSVDVM